MNVEVKYNRPIIHLTADTATVIGQEQAQRIFADVWRTTMQRMADGEFKIWEQTGEMGPPLRWPATLRFVTDERDRATHLSG